MSTSNCTATGTSLDRLSCEEVIIKREFQKASGLTVSDVSFGDDETIHVIANGQEYVMAIGSDDDEFAFHGSSGRVTFDYPNDWVAV